MLLQLLEGLQGESSRGRDQSIIWTGKRPLRSSRTTVMGTGKGNRCRDKYGHGDGYWDSSVTRNGDRNEGGDVDRNGYRDGNEDEDKDKNETRK